MSLFQIYDDLAKACQKRFWVTEKLTLADMVKLIMPPQYPLLLEQGKFKFTIDHSQDHYTNSNGSSITGDNFIAPAYYTANKSLLDNPSKRPNLTLRLHFKVTKTDGQIINWGFEGAGNPTSWNPSVSENSDYQLSTGLLVDEHNALTFSTKGNTQIDLANSYLEIVGGVVKTALSTIKQFFVKRGVA